MCINHKKLYIYQVQMIGRLIKMDPIRGLENNIIGNSQRPAGSVVVGLVNSIALCQNSPPSSGATQESEIYNQVGEMGAELVNSVQALVKDSKSKDNKLK